MVSIRIDSSCTITGANPAQTVQIKEALTLDNPAYTEAVKMGRYTRNIDRHLRYYADIENGLVVPRGFMGELCRMLDKKTRVDNRRVLPELELTFKGKLRPYQQAAVKAILKKDFGVLASATGSGKTVILCAVIAARKQRTLIVCHTVELLNQWRDRIRQFLGIDAGLIGDGHHDIQDVTVAIVNSAVKHLKVLPQLFGQLIIDEAHKSAAPTFIKLVRSFDCRYMLGCTATIERRDNLSKVIQFYLGSVCHEVDKAHLNEIGAVLKPEIMQDETDFWFDYQDDYSRMVSSLCEDEARNSQIVSEALKHQNRGTVLLVSDRVNHCSMLAALLSARGHEPAILTGKMPKKKRLQIVADVQAGKVKFLISTLSLISEGFDCSGLCVLVLTTPVSFKGRITQTVGRILRPGKDKRPLVIDFADNQVGVLRAGARKRLRILKNL